MHHNHNQATFTLFRPRISTELPAPYQAIFLANLLYASHNVNDVAETEHKEKGVLLWHCLKRMQFYSYCSRLSHMKTKAFPLIPAVLMCTKKENKSFAVETADFPVWSAAVDLGPMKYLYLLSRNVQSLIQGSSFLPVFTFAFLPSVFCFVLFVCLF